MFNATLVDAIEDAPDRARDIGIAWTVEQATQLLGRGAPSLHFFVTTSSSAVDEVLTGIGL